MILSSSYPHSDPTIVGNKPSLASPAGPASRLHFLMLTSLGSSRPWCIGCNDHLWPTFDERPPVLRDHFFVNQGVVSQNRYHCTSVLLTCTYVHGSVPVCSAHLKLLLCRVYVWDHLWYRVYGITCVHLSFVVCVGCVKCLFQHTLLVLSELCGVNPYPHFW